MGKTCLDKIASNILTTCAMPVHGIKELYLIYPEDVTVAKATSGTWRTVVFAETGRSYKIEGFKQNIQITSAVRSMDASVKMDFSVMFKVPWTNANIKQMLSGRFYVVAVPNDISTFAATVIGDTCPLEVTATDWDSNANGGLVTVTLGAPEGSSGNYITAVETAALATIISKAS